MPTPCVEPNISEVDGFISHLCQRKKIERKELETLYHKYAGDGLIKDQWIDTGSYDSLFPLILKTMTLKYMIYDNAGKPEEINKMYSRACEEILSLKKTI